MCASFAIRQETPILRYVEASIEERRFSHEPPADTQRQQAAWRVYGVRNKCILLLEVFEVLLWEINGKFVEICNKNRIN